MPIYQQGRSAYNNQGRDQAKQMADQRRQAFQQDPRNAITRAKESRGRTQEAIKQRVAQSNQARLGG